MSFHRCTSRFLSPTSLLLPNPNHHHLYSLILRFFSHHSCLPIPSNHNLNNLQLPNPNPNFLQSDFSTICNLLTSPSLPPGPALEDALDLTGIEPGAPLVQAVFDHLDSSPKPLLTLFLWARKRPGFQPTAFVFNSMINVLAKARQFDSVWSLLFDHIDSDERPHLVSTNTVAILIRRYARAGMPKSAIRTFEFTSNLDLIQNSNSTSSLMEILLDSLCKEGLVRVASGYVDEKKKLDPDWVSSVRIYNILLNGWFRCRKLKQVERLWLEMSEENVIPSVVTYGTLVEGYCRMRRVERAIELVDEMKSKGIEPNAIVYNPIIDALGEAGNLKEAIGMMERFMLCESGPTISTYNSLVKGFCKAGDLVRASRTIKVMTDKELLPTPTTYNYFFRYFSKFGKIEEGMNLYTKMIESGYMPDSLTYHLLMKTLCERERLDLAVQLAREMRVRGFDLDLATSTMLIHLLCRLHRVEDAFAELEDMIRRGVVPQFLTFQKMNDELKKLGMIKLVRKLHAMMSSVPHSGKMPNTYGGGEDASRTRKVSIVQKAKAMSDILKACRDPRELVKGRGSKNDLSTVSRLIDDIMRRLSETSKFKTSSSAATVLVAHKQ